MNTKHPITAQLRLLGTTDLHVSLTGYDYYRNEETVDIGLSRTATLIHQARKEVENHMLFDNGDILQGNPLGDYAASSLFWQQDSYIEATDKVHPIHQLMNTLSYDAATVGNHEFNYGLDYLQQCIEGAQFPYTNANIYHASKDSATAQESDKLPDTLLPPYLILERQILDDHGDIHNIHIGVIGVVPPQIMQWDKAHLEDNITVQDMVKATQYWIPQMRTAGADLIVILAHTGYVDSDDTTVLSENAVLPLSEIEGIDAIFFGHAHKLFPGNEFAGKQGVDLEQGTINGVPAVEAGVWGSHLGIIDLQLHYKNDVWSVEQGISQLRAIYDREQRVSTVEPDLELEQIAAIPHQIILDHIHTPVGESTIPLYSYFALVMDSAYVQIINNAQIWYAQQVLADTLYSHLPIVSAASAFKTGGRYGPQYYAYIEAGKMTLQHTSDIYNYANTLCAVRLTGAEIREWLEWSAGLYQHIDPQVTEEQSLLHPDFPSFNFDIIDGMTYQINVCQPPRYSAAGQLLNKDAHRIEQLRYEGKDVEDHAEYIVVTNQYRAYSTLFANPDGNRVILDVPVENREVLIQYIRAQKVIHPEADHNWSLTLGSSSDKELGLSKPMITVPSSPDAQKILSAHPQLTYAGMNGEGFAIYRIEL
ncbi:bifunctional 2',3'-cyclic-nucleotide 2'-phosphodiesterase/3'-nucleotidase [Paenibacillus nuruki]|uniref:bifunctional 2',3'-cyclic-nucleotide 2'-phosphodiesterase/3'-nucleotidase n=1 Tax=Paenibacillus nuruki TaxID=1886670 RepID=UPI002804FE26|nr:bifunctional 2',3'-cyclic-nucleotide 2'-phosphodiesterase/3'-nucleotidase [Paenibacillus nuruki]CAJ1315692.1 bifunctional 2',3'-cyclic-nucleotide 2'-phosphodiesterase/3'-nucleotidase [Paenibacillus nuruki]